MKEATLLLMLTARERRAQRQTELLQKYRCPLISFTMNIAGPTKTSPLIERAFNYGIEQLTQLLPKQQVVYQRTDVSIAGCEAFFAVNADASALKDICVGIEESSAIGRLFDMDVLDVDGNKLERTRERGCFVCGAQGRGCAARRLHDVPTLQATTQRILCEHFLTADSERIAALAVASLLDEVNTTPKSGLVDRRNNGSHTDMTLDTFYDSANALKPYFAECFTTGWLTAEQSPDTAFSSLREIGIRAEHAMFDATNGVNTHKGAIYIMCALCGALGRLWTPEKPYMGINETLTACANLVNKAVSEDFSSTDRSTFGLRLYHTHGIRGIRGELAAGLPSVVNVGLPVFENALNAGLSPNSAGCVALIHLISCVEDTTLYHRGGIEGARFAAECARRLLAETPRPSAEQIEALDDAFIQKNLSPGGCADLLAATYFLYKLQHEM